MTSGPVVVQVLEGEDAIALNRKLMGATNPQEADAGTIRADFAKHDRCERSPRLRFTDFSGERSSLFLR